MVGIRRGERTFACWRPNCNNESEFRVITTEGLLYDLCGDCARRLIETEEGDQ